MKTTLTSLLAAAAIAGTLAALASDADAQRRRWLGPAIGLGIVGGIAAGAYIASMPRGYAVYPGYAQPVYGPGCYWASQPIYDPYGRVVGYSGRPVMVCPGY